MKKAILLFFVVANIFQSEIYSQPLNYSGWFFLNPIPSTNFLASIRFINSSTGFAVGDHNNIIKTTDGGNNWSYNYELNSVNSLESVYFVNSFTGYATGSRNVLHTLKTTDCGITWSFLQQGIGGGAVFFTSPDTGYTIYNNVLKTTNGGFNWNTSIFNAGLFSIFFINNNVGYIVGQALIPPVGLILKTVNGGINWTSDTIGNTSLSAVFFTNVDTGYIGSSIFAGHVYKTTNAGGNWVQLQGISGPVYSIYFLNSNTGFVCMSGTQGYIYRTNNGGTSWTTSISNFRSALECLYFINVDTGYAVSASSDILFTSNSGLNWTNQKKDFTETGKLLTSVQFTNENTGYTADVSGNIYKSTNSGSNWYKVRSGLPPYYFSIEDLRFVNANTGYAAGDSLTLLKTTDAGENWSDIMPPAQHTYDLYSICFTDSLTTYIAGTDYDIGYIILKTTNSGASWVSQLESPNGYALYTIAFADANTGYAAGMPYLYRTTNAGQNWDQYRVLSTVYGTRISRILFVNQSTGFITSWGGNVSMFKTTDSGNNWTLYSGIGNLLSLYFVNEHTGYGCGFDGIIKTTNCGTNWYPLSSYCSALLSGVSFTSENTGYVVGGGGTILKTTTGGGNIIGITPVSNSVPNEFDLQQNYPNPFNPITVIKFQVAGFRFVKLAVYDLLGKEVAVLVNQSLQPGTYEYEWDGSNHASGIYFYSLVADGFIQTKKMVLIK